MGKQRKYDFMLRFTSLSLGKSPISFYFLEKNLEKFCQTNLEWNFVNILSLQAMVWELWSIVQMKAEMTFDWLIKAVLVSGFEKLGIITFKKSFSLLRVMIGMLIKTQVLSVFRFVFLKF